jgi:phage/plasmid primase-like uncharacterized protein
LFQERPSRQVVRHRCGGKAQCLKGRAYVRNFTRFSQLRHRFHQTRAMSARELGAKFGLHRAGREWRGRCPACGYPNAFSLTDGKLGPLGWCASCGDREAIAQALGNSQKAAKAGTLQVDARGVHARLERAERLLRGCEPAAQSPVVCRYLSARRIGHLADCADIRFRLDCPHPTSTTDRPARLPAMVAAVRDIDGKLCGAHRTYLKRDGSGKANVEPQKASLGPVRGGVVRLAPLEQVLTAGELVIGEGIETSASAGLLLGLPAWAAVSAGNLASSVVLPEAIRRVVIAADRDTPDAQGKCPGQDAARAAWFRLRREGRSVRVALPDEGRGDFNDILKASEVRQ